MPTTETVVRRISADTGRHLLDLHSIWRFRELAYFLVLRDVQIRYKQTIFGVTWVILQPLVSTAVFTVIFGRLAGIATGSAPYALFALAGLVPWNFFLSALGRGSGSLVASSSLITKIYFPRLLIPLSSAVSGVIDVFVALIVLFGLAIFYGYLPNLRIVALVPYLLLAFAAALGASLTLSALYVQFRDVGHVIPFLGQIWFYSTPVVYTLDLIPDRWRLWTGLNPMVSVVEGVRWIVIGSRPPSPEMLALSALSVVVFLAVGLTVFRRMEGQFADVI